jgi:hypothetical protein
MMVSVATRIWCRAHCGSPAALVAGLALVAVAASGDRPARAQAPSGPTGAATAQLAWTMEPGLDCLDAAAFSRAVEARLRRRVFGVLGAALVLEVRLARGARGFVAQLDLRGRGGEAYGSREVTSDAERCDELSQSIAFTAALMLDYREREAAVEATATLARLRSAPLPPPPARTSGVALGVGAEGRLGWGALPELRPGAGVIVEIRGRSVSAFVAGAWWVPATASVDGGGARFEASSVSLGLCPLSLAGALVDARVCAGASVGRVRALGLDLDAPRIALRLVPAALARVEGGLRLVGPLALRLGLEVQAPFARHSYAFRDERGLEGTTEAGTTRRIFRPDPVALTPTLGLVATFQ